jgi:hypothetical protein
MSTGEAAWRAAESAASVLGPEASLLASADAAGPHPRSLLPLPGLT